MRKLPTVIAVLVGLSLTTTTTKADIYNVNSVIGVGGVVGTIETDGTLGLLTTPNIVDWNLVITDSLGSFNLLGPNGGGNSQTLVVGANFTATSTDLLFDFSLTDSTAVIFQNPSIGSGINFWCLDDANGICSGNLSAEVVEAVSGISEVAPRTGVVSVATRVVPEPTSAIVLAVLPLLGVIRRRR